MGEPTYKPSDLNPVQRVIYRLLERYASWIGDGQLPATYLQKHT